MPSPSNAAVNYLPQLDSLRAFAVILVCIHHWVHGRYSLGIIGVQLFFVLSGYLITGILLNLRKAIVEGKQTWRFSLRRFYIRRFLRIFPLYYFCLFVFFALDLFGIREAFPWHLFYLSNVYFFLRGQFSGQFSHFWSLAVEEQFYLFWPCLVLLASRARMWAAGFICVSLALRIWFFVIGTDNFAQYGTLVFSNLDTLGMGALIAWASNDGEEEQRRAKRWLALAAPCCLAEIVLARFYQGLGVWMILDPVAIGALSAWVVWKASTGFQGVVGRILELPVLVAIGRISYGIYVWHMFAPSFLRGILRTFGLSPGLNFGVWGLSLSFLITILIATITWTLFEKPINNLKRFFPYQGKGRLTKSHPLPVVTTS